MDRNEERYKLETDAKWEDFRRDWNYQRYEQPAKERKRAIVIGISVILFTVSAQILLLWFVE